MNNLQIIGLFCAVGSVVVLFGGFYLISRRERLSGLKEQQEPRRSVGDEIQELRRQLDRIENKLDNRCHPDDQRKGNNTEANS